MKEIDLKAVGSFVHDRLFKLREITEKSRSFYSNTISLENVIYWLLQFGSTERIMTAYTLLENIRFIPEAQLIGLLTKTITASVKFSNNARLCPIGHIIDSGGFLTYPLAKALKLPESEQAQRFVTCDKLAEVLSNDGSIEEIIFYDDNIASGTQIRKFLSELLVKDTPDREHVAESLPESAIKRFQDLTISYCVGIALNPTTALEESIRSKFNLKKFHIIAGSRSEQNYLDYSAGIWQDDKSALEAQRWLGNISEQLYRDKEWPEEKIQDRLLGYGNLARLIVFQHNTPKSLPPIFWKSGMVADRPWFPLFPDRDEWAKNKESILSFEPYIKHFANSLAAGAFGDRKPVPSVTFSLSDGDAMSISCTVPSDKIRELLLKHKMGKHQPLTEEHDSSQTGKYPKMMLQIEAKDYGRYNKEVHIYNEKIVEYEKDLKAGIEKICTTLDLPFRVYNRGISPAHEVILNITLPPFVTFIEDIEDLLPDEPSIPEPPKSTFMNFPTIRSDSSIFHQINRNLVRNQTASDKKYKLSYHNGQQIITIYFNKVLQHTYRDYDLAYIYLTEERETFSLQYQLICEEIDNPIEGALEISLEKRDNLTSHLFDPFGLKTE